MCVCVCFFSSLFREELNNPRKSPGVWGGAMKGKYRLTSRSEIVLPSVQPVLRRGCVKLTASNPGRPKFRNLGKDDLNQNLSNRYFVPVNLRGHAIQPVTDETENGKLRALSLTLS